MMGGPPNCRRLLFAAVLASRLAAAGDLQDISQLEELARTKSQRLLPPLSDKQRLQVGPIQPHLQLARCENAVQAIRAPGIPVQDRVLIELRCEARTPWHLYVPVKVVGITSVVLAAHAIVGGSALTAKDMSVEQRDVVGLPPGYLNDPAIAIGLTAGRSIAAGTVLTAQQLMGARAVQRGQTVTLVANAGGVSIQMAGRALSDGLINQRVRVENLSSGKTVEGIARSEQMVEIILQ
jgi:flagellar basal body P-ring formation protein FlgA